MSKDSTDSIHIGVTTGNRLAQLLVDARVVSVKDAYVVRTLLQRSIVEGRASIIITHT